MKVSECTLIKPLSCGEDANIIDVARTLRDNRQRRVVVVDANSYPAGIISTTDINNRVVAEEKDASQTTAKSVMTSPIYLICNFDEGLDEVFRKMISHESFFCPVVREGKLCGILTYGELLKRVNGNGNNG